MASKLSLSIITFAIYLFFATTDFSQGNAYQRQLITFKNELIAGNYEASRGIERRLSKLDVVDLKERYLPEYQEIKIQRLLSKLEPGVDTYLHIAQLYLNLNDKNSALQYLKLAQKIDPIRPDITTAIQSLSP